MVPKISAVKVEKTKKPSISLLQRTFFRVFLLTKLMQQMLHELAHFSLMRHSHATQGVFLKYFFFLLNFMQHTMLEEGVVGELMQHSCDVALSL